MTLSKSSNMDIINDCLYCTSNFHDSELIQERKEKFVSKFACCHSALAILNWLYLVKIVFLCMLLMPPSVWWIKDFQKARWPRTFLCIWRHFRWVKKDTLYTPSHTCYYRYLAEFDRSIGHPPYMQVGAKRQNWVHYRPTHWDGWHGWHKNKPLLIELPCFCSFYVECSGDPQNLGELRLRLFGTGTWLAHKIKLSRIYRSINTSKSIVLHQRVNALIEGNPKNGSAGPLPFAVGAWLRAPSSHVTLPNLVVLGQTERALLRRFTSKIWLFAPRLSMPLKFIGTDTFHSNHWPVSYCFRDKRRFQFKIENCCNVI